MQCENKFFARRFVYRARSAVEKGAMVFLW